MNFLIVFLLSVVLAQDAVDVGDYDDMSSFGRVTGGQKAKFRIVPSFVALRIYYGKVGGS
jgi:hypothetical protein